MFWIDTGAVGRSLYYSHQPCHRVSSLLRARRVGRGPGSVLCWLWERRRVTGVSALSGVFTPAPRGWFGAPRQEGCGSSRAPAPLRRRRGFQPRPPAPPARGAVPALLPGRSAGTLRSSRCFERRKEPAGSPGVPAERAGSCRSSRPERRCALCAGTRP